MSIDNLKLSIPEYAKDLRINLSSVLSENGAPGLNKTQRYGTAVAVAYALGSGDLLATLEHEAGAALDDAYGRAARAAAALMGMNNIYYRFLHLTENQEYAQLPARLRMSVIANPGIDKVDFELFCLAVSAVNGCGMCMDSHEKLLRQHHLSIEAIQSAVRIAAVLNAVARVLCMAEQDRCLSAVA